MTDSQVLSLQYEWVFLGHLVTFIDSRLQDTALDLIRSLSHLPEVPYLPPRPTCGGGLERL